SGTSPRPSARGWAGSRPSSESTPRAPRSALRRNDGGAGCDREECPRSGSRPPPGRMGATRPPRPAEAGRRCRVRADSARDPECLLSSIPLGLLPSGRGARAALFVARQKLPGQAQVALGARRGDVVKEDRLAEARRLRKPHVAGNDALEDLLAEVAADLALHLRRERGPPVVHGEENALDLEAGIEALPDELDGGEQGRKAFHGV